MISCDWLHESHRIQDEAENWNELNDLLGREGGIPIKGLSALGKWIKMEREPVDSFNYWKNTLILPQVQLSI